MAFLKFLACFKVKDDRPFPAELFVLKPSFFQAEIAIETLKTYRPKSPGVKFQQNGSKQKVKHYNLRSTNQLIVF
jgi:hypothetical protein